MSDPPPAVGALCASMRSMLEERRVRTRTPEWRALHERIRVAMELTSAPQRAISATSRRARRVAAPSFSDEPLPEKAIIHPPFYCTYGLGTVLGEQTSVGSDPVGSLDLGGITVGERTMISPKVTLVTEGRPVELADRYDFVRRWGRSSSRRTYWIGAAAAGVRARGDDRPRLDRRCRHGRGRGRASQCAIVTGAGQVQRKHLEPRGQLRGLRPRGRG